MNDYTENTCDNASIDSQGAYTKVIYPDKTIKDLAKLANRGFRVIPVAKDTKHPCVHGWQNKGVIARTERDLVWHAENPETKVQYTVTFSPNKHELGVVCVPPLFVIDIDCHNTGDKDPKEVYDQLYSDFHLLPTYVVKTRNKGLHLYFYASDASVHLLDQIDLGAMVKAYKQQVEFKSGHKFVKSELAWHYKCDVNMDIATVDITQFYDRFPKRPFLKKEPKELKQWTTEYVDNSHPYVRKSIENAITRLQAAKAGENHNAVLAFAVNMGSFTLHGVDVEQVIELALQHYNGRDNEAEVERTVRDGYDHGAINPVAIENSWRDIQQKQAEPLKWEKPSNEYREMWGDLFAFPCDTTPGDVQRVKGLLWTDKNGNISHTLIRENLSIMFREDPFLRNLGFSNKAGEMFCFGNWHAFKGVNKPQVDRLRVVTEYVRKYINDKYSGVPWSNVKNAIYDHVKAFFQNKPAICKKSLYRRYLRNKHKANECNPISNLIDCFVLKDKSHEALVSFIYSFHRWFHEWTCACALIDRQVAPIFKYPCEFMLMLNSGEQGVTKSTITKEIIPIDEMVVSLTVDEFISTNVNHLLKKVDAMLIILDETRMSNAQKEQGKVKATMSEHKVTFALKHQNATFTGYRDWACIGTSNEIETLFKDATGCRRYGVAEIEAIKTNRIQHTHSFGTLFEIVFAFYLNRAYNACYGDPNKVREFLYQRHEETVAEIFYTLTGRDISTEEAVDIIEVKKKEHFEEYTDSSPITSLVFEAIDEHKRDHCFHTEFMYRYLCRKNAAEKLGLKIDKWEVKAAMKQAKKTLGMKEHPKTLVKKQYRALYLEAHPIHSPMLDGSKIGECNMEADGRYFHNNLPVLNRVPKKKEKRAPEVGKTAEELHALIEQEESLIQKYEVQIQKHPNTEEALHEFIADAKKRMAKYKEQIKVKEFDDSDIPF